MSKETGIITRVNYEAGGEKIELSLMDVKNYLVNGDASKVTNQEVGMFLKLCEGQKLNPFLREAYLVKYGNAAAQMVVGKDTFTKRAEANPNYKGQKSGVIVINFKGELEEREGTFYIPKKEELVGGWAKVFFKDDKEPVYNTVTFEEYNTGKSLWAGKPATMIKKVALVQALREAFPNSLSQLYIQEEVGINEELPSEPVNVDKEKSDKWQGANVAGKKATAGTKKQLMSLAREKGFMIGDGKDADVAKLEELCKQHNMSLRGLSEQQAQDLIKILVNYQETQPENEVQDVEYENVEPVEESVENQNNEPWEDCNE